MSSDLPEIPETHAEKAAETARIRRRWLSLGETVAVVAVVISALTLWNNYDERRSAEAERRAEKANAQQTRPVGLIATDAGGSGLSFKAADCALQSADISFPSALGVASENTVLEHRIDVDGFEDELLAAIGKDARDGRLPVVIASRCEGADGPRTETAIYDLVYRVEPRMLLGRTIKLRGLVRRETVSGDGLARLDTLWKPKP